MPVVEQIDGSKKFRNYMTGKVLEEYPVVDPDSALDVGLFLTKGGGYLPLKVILSPDYKGNPEDEFKGYGNGVFRHSQPEDQEGSGFIIPVTDAEKLHELLRRSEIMHVRKASIEELF
jgi:hypothetical protein